MRARSWIALALLLAAPALAPAAQAEQFWYAELPNGCGYSATIAVSSQGGSTGTYRVFDGSGGPPLAIGTAPAWGTGTWMTPGSLPTNGLYPNAAWRIDADPGLVAAYFNPEDAAAVTNDAGRLLDWGVLDREYWAFSWPATGDSLLTDCLPDTPTIDAFMAVVATRDATAVTVTSPTAVPASGGAPAFPAGTPTSLTMNDHDVLLLSVNNGDFTGAHVVASKPVAVFSGQSCSVVGTSSCDHMSDQLLPTTVGGDEFAFCGTAPDRGVGFDQVRVMAIEPGTTTITLTPAPPSVPGGVITLGGPGQWADFEMRGDVVIRSDKDIFAGAYLGKDATSNLGDPAFVQLTPSSRYGNGRAFWVPPSWNLALTIAMPTSATVDLVGPGSTPPMPILPARAIGSTGFSCGFVDLNSVGGAGTYFIDSSVGIGASIWALETAASFWYEAGGSINPEIAWAFDNTADSCEDSAVRFWDDGTEPIPGRTFARWDWDFGDGTMGVGQEVEHTYANAGTYTVELAITDSTGYVVRLSKTVTSIGDPNCPPTIVGPIVRTVPANRQVRVCFTASDPEGDPLTFELGPPDPPADMTWYDGNCVMWTPDPLDRGVNGPWILSVRDAAGGAAATSLTIHVLHESGELPDDQDQDGVSDEQDNCPEVPNTDQADVDGDGVGDVCKLVRSGDGHDGSGLRDPATADEDMDGVADVSDNCPSLANRDQRNLDGDLLGDLCDADADGDGMLQEVMLGAFSDNCPLVVNPGQEDRDADGVGDACELGATGSPTTGQQGTGTSSGPASGKETPWPLGLALAALGLALMRRRRAD